MRLRYIITKKCFLSQFVFQPIYFKQDRCLSFRMLHLMRPTS